MSQQIEQQTEVSLTIILTAVAVAITDNIIVAISSSIPWIIDPNVHAFFMASVLTFLCLVAIFTIAKREKMDISKLKIILIPIGVFYFAFFFDRFVLNYIKSLSLTPLILSIGTTTFQVAQTMLYSSVVLIVVDIAIMFLALKFVGE